MISEAQRKLVASQDELIREMYTRKVLPVRDYEKIARELGITWRSVYRAIKRMGLPSVREIQRQENTPLSHHD